MHGEPACRISAGQVIILDEEIVVVGSNVHFDVKVEECMVS
jgi:hypothetical protein